MMTRSFWCGVTLSILIATAVPLTTWAQEVTPSQQSSCDRYHQSDRCQQLVNEFYFAHGLIADRPIPLDKPWGDTTILSNKIAPKALQLQLSADLKAKADAAAQKALQTISTSAAVNQTGASPSGGAGSTNLVTKPTTTDFISLAAESGAFTDTLNGNTLTLQANGLGLTKYLANNPVFVRWDSRLADRIQPLNFAVSLNVQQNGSSTVATAGPANSSTPSVTSIIIPSNNTSFASFRASYVLYRPYNPQDQKFKEAWNKALAANQDLLNSTGASIKVALDKLLPGDFMEKLAENMAEPQSHWRQDGTAAEKKGDFDAFVAAYDTYDSAVRDYILSRPDAPKTALDLSNALAAFNAATYTVLNQARGTPLATFSYTYATPTSKPATHDFTVVVSNLFRGGKDIKDANGNKTGRKDESRTFLSGAQLTGNFTASIFAQLPAGVTYGRLRALQASGEFDKPLGGTIAEPRAVLSAAGYGQFQYDPTVLNISQGNLVPGTNITLPSNAQVLLGTSGWLGVVQGKIVFNLSKGLNIPVAIKWSNKTDLLTGNDIRGQIGLSYDLSALSKVLSSKQ
jgi:hypothetical protein